MGRPFPGRKMQHEAYFTFQVPVRKDGSTEEDYLCSFNQRAMRTVWQVTGKDPVRYLLDTDSLLDRIQVLAYACTETFRRGNGYVVTFDEFIDGPYLGVYGSSYWSDLVTFIQELVTQTFPWVDALKNLVLSASTNEASPSSQSTGTEDSTVPSSSKSSKRQRNSGTSGTSAT